MAFPTLYSEGTLPPKCAYIIKVAHGSLGLELHLSLQVYIIRLAQLQEAMLSYYLLLRVSQMLDIFGLNKAFMHSDCRLHACTQGLGAK